MANVDNSSVRFVIATALKNLNPGGVLFLKESIGVSKVLDTHVVRSLDELKNIFFPFKKP